MLIQHLPFPLSLLCLREVKRLSEGDPLIISLSYLLRVSITSTELLGKVESVLALLAFVPLPPHPPSAHAGAGNSPCPEFDV